MRFVSRRSFLAGAAAICGGVALSACSQSTGSTAATAPPAAATKPPAPTVGSAPSSVAAAASVAPSPSAAVVTAAPSVVAGPLTKVTGSWVAQTANQMILPLALDAGYFQKYGIDFDLSYLNGSVNGIAALVSHSLDLITAAGSAVIGAQAADQDIVMVMGFVNESIFRVMSPASITSLGELKGKTIAVTKVGSADYFAWELITQEQGWTMNDVNFVSAGDVPGQIALLQNGQVQAIAVSPPNDVRAIDAGAHQILDTTSYKQPEQQNGLVVPREYLTNHRDLVLGVSKACVEAIARWKKDPAFTKQVINKYLPSDNPQFTEVGYSAYRDVYPEVPYPTKEGMAEVAKEVASQNPKAKDVDLDKSIDMSIVKQLEDSGFIKQIYGS